MKLITLTTIYPTIIAKLGLEELTGPHIHAESARDSVRSFAHCWLRIDGN